MSYTDKVGLNKTIQGLKGKVPDLINNFVTEKVLIYEGESIDKTTWFGNNKPLMSDFLRYIYTINNNKVYIPKYMYLLAQLEQTKIL